MTKKPTPHARGIINYKTYMFRDKDPVIDLLRTMIQISGMTYEEIHAKSGVAETTLFAWFHGLTRRPRYATIAAVVGAIGGRIEIIGPGETGRAAQTEPSPSVNVHVLHRKPRPRQTP